MRATCWILTAITVGGCVGDGAPSGSGLVSFDPGAISVDVGASQLVTLEIDLSAVPADELSGNAIDVTCARGGPHGQGPFTFQFVGAADLAPLRIADAASFEDPEVLISCHEHGVESLGCEVHFEREVDGATEIGEASLSVQCGELKTGITEVCDNGLDDDKDGAVDCDDQECARGCALDAACNTSALGVYGGVSGLVFVAAEHGNPSIAPDGTPLVAEGNSDLLCTAAGVPDLDTLDNLALSCDEPSVTCGPGARDTPVTQSLVVVAVLDGPVTLDDPDHGYFYGVYLETDATPGNDYVTQKVRPHDPGIGTDTWLTWSTGTEGWSVRTLEGEDGGASAVEVSATDARVAVQGSTVMWVLPFSEGPALAAYRVVAHRNGDGSDAFSAKDAYDQSPGAGQDLRESGLTRRR